jgi:hypothetical protein
VSERRRERAAQARPLRKHQPRGGRAGERIRRDTGDASLGLRWFARLAAGARRARSRRWRRAGFPNLIHFDGRVLERGYLAGRTMPEAQPRDPRYFRAAHRLLRALRERGVAHNDLAKEANWMVLSDGTPGLLDFQLARELRAAALVPADGARGPAPPAQAQAHLLPERVTPTERRVLARRSWLARAWMASGKKLYIFVARRILNWEDNEARGRRKR